MARDIVVRYGPIGHRWRLGRLDRARWQTGLLNPRWTFGRIMPQQQSTLSLQYVRCPVNVTVNGVAYNPTGDTAQMAFVTQGNPASGDWKTAAWETGPSGAYWVICLVGPGGAVSLPVGTYRVWVKITDNPEIPATPVDTLYIN